jgi:aryl-alcohol dehydrogenase-like predicted oxidoreductase
MSENTTFTGDDLRRMDPKFTQPLYGQYLRAVRRLDDLSRERFGKPVIDLAIAWALARPGVGAALWGARRPDQLAPVDDAFRLHLDQATFAEVESILAEEIPHPVGPEFMAPPESAGA